MWADEDHRLSPTRISDGLDARDSRTQSKHFRSSSSPFSITDLDMWDTKSRFSAQSSAWCGMASVSGAGFLSKVSTSTSGSTGGFRHNDPGMRRWQSLSRLAPECPTRSFPPTPGMELRAALNETSFRRAELMQWLEEVQDRLDSQLDLFSIRDTQLHHSVTGAQLLDMKHKHRAETVNVLEQEREAAELSRFEDSRQRGELHEKVRELEMDMLKMRSNLERGSIVQPERSPSSLRSLPIAQEEFDKQKTVTELCKVREALKAEERNQALQQLQKSKDEQRTLLNQMEEMNQRLNQTIENHAEVQKQLSEANSKLSQACLEKAVMSTQVLKLEDNIKELKTKHSDKHLLIKEKADLHQRVQSLELQLQRAREGTEDCTDTVCKLNVQLPDTDSHGNRTVLMTEELMSLREVNQKLTCEIETIKQSLEMSQSQLRKLTAEKIVATNRIADLQAERTRLIRDKEELQSKMKEGGREEQTEMREKHNQLRESLETVQSDRQTLQDLCLCLETEVLDKEEKLHLQEEAYQKQDAGRLQDIEELRAVAAHWSEKWQNVALTLRSTQSELEDLRNNDPRNRLQDDAVQLAKEVEKLRTEGLKDKEEIENLLKHKAYTETAPTTAKKESVALLRVELDACKQELELERSRSQTLLNIYKDKGKGGEAAQTENKETETKLSVSTETPSDSDSSQNTPPQACSQGGEIQRLEQKLAEREKELSETNQALTSVEGLRETENNKAQIKISALERKLVKKASGDSRDHGSQADVDATDLLWARLAESKRKANQLRQEKTLAVQRLQTLRQLYRGKADKPPVEGNKEKAACPLNAEPDMQRRMVTEQLKSLFKEREGGGEEAVKVDDTSTAAQNGACSAKSNVIKNALDWRGQQHGSGLMPVFEEEEEEEEEQEEEEEESSDQPGEDEEERQEVTHDEGDSQNQNQQMSAVSVETRNMKGEHENPHQAMLSFVQPNLGGHRAAERLSDKSPDVGVPNPSHASEEGDLQQMLPSPLPDGIFLAELVDTICSPDEDEAEEGDKRGVS